MDQDDPRRPTHRGPHPLAQDRRVQQEQAEEIARTMAAQRVRDENIAVAASQFGDLCQVAARWLACRLPMGVTAEPSEQCAIEGRIDDVRAGAEPFCQYERGHPGPHSWEKGDPNYQASPAQG